MPNSPRCPICYSNDTRLEVVEYPAKYNIEAKHILTCHVCHNTLGKPVSASLNTYAQMDVSAYSEWFHLRELAAV